MVDFNDLKTAHVLILEVVAIIMLKLLFLQCKKKATWIMDKVLLLSAVYLGSPYYFQKCIFLELRNRMLQLLWFHKGALIYP